MLSNRHELYPWEEKANNAVANALERAEFDDIRGVIALREDDTKRVHWSEYRNIDELHLRLEEIYDAEWYAYVPFDSGEAVFEADGSGYVGDLLVDRKIEDFFYTIRGPESAKEIFTSRELVEKTEHSQVLRIDLQCINEKLIRYLARNPHYMRSLEPRKFEELIAELFRDKGYEIELTPRSRDGGYDIMAIEKSDLGAALTLIECKRYAELNKVGVDIVRGLYGVVEQKRATRGLIVTTSYFSSDAVALRDKLQYRLSFADFDCLTQWLSQWKTRHQQ